MIARAVKHKLKSRPNISHVPAVSSEVSELRAIIEQLRCSNKKLTNENVYLKSKCVALEVDLKSTNDLLLESNLKYENLLNDHKVLENNYMEVSTPLTSIKDDNTCLAHKVNTLNLQLSLESGKKRKIVESQC